MVSIVERLKPRAWWQWVLAGLAVVIVLTALFGEDEPTTTGGDQATQSEPAEETPRAEAPDTGRMSEGEYAQLTDALDQYDSELVEFGDGVGKCGRIAEAGQLAEASDCIEEAYDGVEGQASLSLDTMDQLRGDVARRCRGALLRARRALNAQFAATATAAKFAEDLEFDVVVANQRTVERRGRAYRRSKVQVRRVCRPT